MTTIGFIGAGHVGGALARIATDAGYQVVVSNSRGPETLVDLVQELGDTARAGTATEAAEAGDVVVVTLPFGAYPDVPVEPLAGKVVIDTTNYHPRRDGHVAELDAGSTTSSELLQAHLPASRVVKAFNHLTAADLGRLGSRSDAADRRAIVVAADDAEARATVVRIIDRLGFDAVDAGPLGESWRIEPGTPGYGPPLDPESLTQALVGARREPAPA
jgi:8-hydroxy-5-deazaflavin:NADPH oxidoreductase